MSAIWMLSPDLARKPAFFFMTSAGVSKPFGQWTHFGPGLISLEMRTNSLLVARRMRKVHKLGGSTALFQSLHSSTQSRSHSSRTNPHRHRLRHDFDDGEDRRRRLKQRLPEEAGGAGGCFHLHKSRGQHLLTNPRVLDSIVRRAQVRPTDTVLEIGPGTGNLTTRLLESAGKVVAVEIDERMVDALHRRVAQLGLQDRLTVITTNALRTQFPPFDVCVANIPYGISSPLLAKLLLGPSRPSFRSATLLLQKEFARRLLAEPGDSEFNRLSANVRLVATVKLLMDVSKKDFVPCPKVDSSLVHIRPRPEIPAVDLDEWLAFTRTCFGKKNKTLGAIFKQKKLVMELHKRTQSNGRTCEASGIEEEEDDDEVDEDKDEDGEGEEEEGGDSSEVGLFKEKIVGILKRGGLDEKRPSKLSNEEFLHLLRLFNQEGVLFHQQRLQN